MMGTHPGERTVYLDFAATSAVRPATVVRAVADYLEHIGATAGRSGHRLAIDAGRVALRCRQALARLLDLPGDPGRIAFMFNATHALNTALWGTLRENDVLVVTTFDHNAVLRPAHVLRRVRGIDVRHVDVAPDGSVDERVFARAVDGARLVALNAVSNVLGARVDVGTLAALAHAAGAYVLVDAAQAAGHIPLSPAADGADLVALSGHKGLLGPQGVGALWVREGVSVEPLLTGGTGGDSLDAEMPVAYPDHLEAGTLNGPGIAGLLAGVEWLLDRNVAALHAELAERKHELRDGLAGIAGVRVRSPAAPEGGAIVTITADGMDASTLALRLDREHGVMTRAGLHCAPDVHRMLGTASRGALRFSLGWCSTADDVRHAVAAVDRIMARTARVTSSV